MFIYWIVQTWIIKQKKEAKKMELIRKKDYNAGLKTYASKKQVRPSSGFRHCIAWRYPNFSFVNDDSKLEEK